MHSSFSDEDEDPTESQNLVFGMEHRGHLAQSTSQEDWCDILRTLKMSYILEIALLGLISTKHPYLESKDL